MLTLIFIKFIAKTGTKIYTVVNHVTCFCCKIFLYLLRYLITSEGEVSDAGLLISENSSIN